MTDQQLKSGQHGGLTLIEVVVVILIVIVLAALFAPAARSARVTSRKLECMNSIRNVGIALQNVAVANTDELPPLTSTLQISNRSGDGNLSVGWPVLILPALDQAALYRSIKNTCVVTNGTATLAPGDRIWLRVFTCPQDADSNTEPGGLSFVVNAGFISSEVWGIPETAMMFHQPYLINWKGSAAPPFRSGDVTSATGNPSPIDLEIALATGVCWRRVGNDKQSTYSSSFGYASAGDGSSYTLLLAENLNAGPWYSADVNSIGFGIRIPVNRSNHAPSVGATKPYGEFDSVLSLNTSFPGSTFATASSESWINKTAAGTTPRPSSRHGGGVNVVICDGSSRFLNEHIDPSVYGRLVTSNGTAFHEKQLRQSEF
jgi:prepilin-type processing-associated H-X9-DG protein